MDPVEQQLAYIRMDPVAAGPGLLGRIQHGAAAGSVFIISER